MLFISCSNEAKPLPFEPLYSLFVSKGESTSIILIDSAWKHTVNVPSPHPSFSREFIQKNSNIYHVNPHSNYFIKYRLTQDRLEAVDSIKLINNNIEQYHWKNNSDTLLLCNVVHGKDETARFYEIDTKSFTLIREHVLPIPCAVNDFDILSMGLLKYVDQKLWIAYAYSKMLGRTNYTTLDTMYYMTLDFSSLDILSEQKDPRSTYPGGINTVQNYSVTAENGDFYFMSCPGIAAGNAIDIPTAIFRIKKGSDLVDTSYMINISEKIKNHAYGLWYAGNHKAIIRGEQQEKFTDFSNHHSVYQFEYYLIDLQSGEFEKLALPLDKGTRKENVLIEGKHIYFAIDDEQNRHIVWQYDTETKNTKAFLEPSQPIDYMLRLDKLR